MMELPGSTWIATTVIMIMQLITDVASVECYSCAYIPGKESQSSCSDPWSWTRDKFNSFTGPPRRTCAEACVKTVIEKPGYWSSVLRMCGSMCNETSEGTSLTTCCDTDLCNAATSSLLRTSSKLWPTQALVWILLPVATTLLVHWIQCQDAR